MESYISREFLENYEGADIILSILFAVIDFIIIIFSLFHLNSKNKKIYLLKYKLFAIFIIDIISRMFYVNRYYKVKSLFMELLFSALISSQFFLILSFLEQAYNDTKMKKKGKFFTKLKRNYICSVFLIITFPYDKFSSSQKEAAFIQSMIIIYCIYFLYIRMKNKIIKIVQNIIKQTSIHNKNIFFCLMGSPLPCLIFFLSYYILRIIFLYITNPEFIVYANLALKIIKDSSKYFLFIILEIILYLLSENKLQKEKFCDDLEEKNDMKNKD